MSALREPRWGMTVEEFLEWCPEDGGRWQLVDGAPMAMAPPSADNARLHSELAFVVGAHLRAARPKCTGLIGAGVVPLMRSAGNFRIPDFAVSCAPAEAGSRAAEEPVLIVEVLSPSNAYVTRQNVWAYATIPSVEEIVLLGGTRIVAELYRRGPDREWGREAVVLRDGEVLEFASIGLALPLRDLYRTTSLAAAG